MARVLLLLAIGLAVWLLVRQVGGARRRSDAPPGPIDHASGPAGIESTVQCAWCGVHVPRGDAVTLADGRGYCSVAHRDAARTASSAAEPAGHDGA